MISAATNGWDQVVRPRVPAASLCRRVLAALHVGILLLADDELVWANPATVRLLGTGRDRERALAAVRELAGLIERPEASCGEPGMRLLGSVYMPGGRLRVCGSRLAASRRSPRCVVLIVLERWPRSERVDRSADDAALRRRYQLTPQELRVARMLADGFSNARIAESLAITPNTARIHTERVLRKLGIHSRSAVASTLLHG